MTKKGSRRKKKYTAKYDGTIDALRSKHWQTQAKTNTQIAQFKLSTVDQNISDLINELNPTYGARAMIQYFIRKMVIAYPNLTEPQLEAYHTRFLQFGFSESEWSDIIALLEAKQTEFVVFWYLCEIYQAKMKVSIALSGLPVIHNWSIWDTATLDYDARLTIQTELKEIEVLKTGSYVNQGQNSLQNLVCAHRTVSQILPIFNAPVLKWTPLPLFNPLISISVIFHAQPFEKPILGVSIGEISVNNNSPTLTISVVNS